MIDLEVIRGHSRSLDSFIDLISFSVSVRSEMELFYFTENSEL